MISLQLEPRDVQEINDFRGAIFVRDADGPSSRHYPDKIGMGNVKSPLV